MKPDRYIVRNAFWVWDDQQKRDLCECQKPQDCRTIVDALNHRCSLPESMQEAFNSGDGSYRP